MTKTREQLPTEDDASYLRSARIYARYRFSVHSSNDPHCHESHNVAMALRDTERRFVDLGTCGVEGDCEENGDGHITIQYLNSGDSYAPSIFFYEGRFIVTTLGDLVQ